MLNELKDIIVPRVLSVLGPRSKREREKGEGRESTPDQGRSLCAALKVEYREDPGYKVADTNWLRN